METKPKNANKLSTNKIRSTEIGVSKRADEADEETSIMAEVARFLLAYYEKHCKRT